MLVEFLGPASAGKTSLLQALEAVAPTVGARVLPVFEDFDRLAPALALGRDPSPARISLMQACFYWATFERASVVPEPGMFVVSDHSISVHHFGYSRYFLDVGLIRVEDWLDLDKLHGLLRARIGVPRVSVFCQANATLCQERKVARGRFGDSPIPLAMFQAVVRACESVTPASPADRIVLDMNVPARDNAMLLAQHLARISLP